jgi:excisionase family DNA binding protein
MDNKHTRPLTYSVKDACAVSSLGRTTLYTHINSGRLKAIRLGGRTLIPADSLHALLEGREQDQ